MAEFRPWAVTVSADKRTLVERLREAILAYKRRDRYVTKAELDEHQEAIAEAADELERQEREIERLRGELEALRDGSPRHLSRRIAELQARGFERVNAPDPQLTRESPERYGLGGTDG